MRKGLIVLFLLLVISFAVIGLNIQSNQEDSYQIEIESPATEQMIVY